MVHVFVQIRGVRPATAQLEAIFNISDLRDLRASSLIETSNDVLLIKTFPVTVDLLMKAMDSVPNVGRKEEDEEEV